jgi:hypothetical protein
MAGAGGRRRLAPPDHRPSAPRHGPSATPARPGWPHPFTGRRSQARQPHPARRPDAWSVPLALSVDADISAIISSLADYAARPDAATLMATPSGGRVGSATGGRGAVGPCGEAEPTRNAPPRTLLLAGRHHPSRRGRVAGWRPGCAGTYESLIQAILHLPVRASVHAPHEICDFVGTPGEGGPWGKPGFPSRWGYMPSIARARSAIAMATRVSGSSIERPVRPSMRSIR